eukprot:TRINITY_DN5646_c0_g1_i1.p1 TRINITY_DN5646_c0_g1~~TRINITY_DN5646_c0_g1_i1.p1  ORF type:complete len:115 (+),score=29.27 TRINITY_DN5646_c0_g1_i1:214-558(+)
MTASLKRLSVILEEGEDVKSGDMLEVSAVTSLSFWGCLVEKLKYAKRMSNSGRRHSDGDWSSSQRKDKRSRGHTRSRKNFDNYSDSVLDEVLELQFGDNVSVTIADNGDVSFSM